MPMGIVSDDEFEKELKNSSVPISAVVEPLPTKGRKEGDVNVPDSLRKVIGETSEIEGRKSAVDFAHLLGVSPSSVSAYANSATSTSSYNRKSESLDNHMQGRKSKIANTALARLNRSLGILTKEKINTASAREVAAIAKDMAAIVKQMEPENTDNPAAKNQPQFVVYAPTFRDERSYETIVAKDNF
jgi:predicted transcriptional regulator